MQVVRVEVGKCRLASACSIQHGYRQEQQQSHEVEEIAKHAREQSKLQHCREAQQMRKENNKAMVQEYSKYRRTIAHQQEQCQVDMIEMAKHHKHPTRLRNSERVKYRQQVLAKKQEEALQQNEMLAEEQKQREQRMERMRALVSTLA